MISLMILTTSIMVMSLAQTQNPVKISMILLVASMFMFMATYFLTSSLWFPLIMFLVFMGGVLMMFMILSSILPNEKTQKSMKKWSISIFLLVWMLSTKTNLSTSSAAGIKNLASSSMTMIFLFLLVTSYFAVVMFTQKFNKSPLRTTILC